MPQASQIIILFDIIKLIRSKDLFDILDK